MNWLRTYGVPLPTLFVFAVLVFVIVAPLLAFPFYAGEKYHGINIAHFGNDEHYYLSRANEALEGHALGQPYLMEGKDQADSFMSDVEYVMAAPFRAVGLADYIDPVVLFNTLNTLGIFVVLVLMYTLAYLLSGDVLLATTCALFAVGGYSLIFNKTLFYHDFNFYQRSVYPYTAHIPFFSFLILTYCAAMSRFRKFSVDRAPYLYVLGAGFLFGALFYVYLYGWSYALAFVGAFGFASLIWRKWHAFFAASAIGIIGLLIGSYRLYGMYHLYSSPIGEQLSYFFLATRTHAPIMSLVGILSAFLFAIYWRLRPNDRNNFFLFAIILAGWIALDQQIITGRIVQYGHYYWYFVVPLAIIISLYMLAQLLPEQWSVWRTRACLLLIGVVFVNTIGGQYLSFWTTLPDKMREQDLAPIVEKLSQSPYGVVLGDPGAQAYTFLTTIYTRDDVYWMDAAASSAFATEHLKDALIMYLYLNKNARRDPVAYLSASLASATSSVYENMYIPLEGLASGAPLTEYYGSATANSDPRILAVRPRLLSELNEEYRAVTSSPAHVREALSRRGVRYILWDKKQFPEWDVGILGPLSLIATSTDVELFELK